MVSTRLSRRRRRRRPRRWAAASTTAIMTTLWITMLAASSPRHFYRPSNALQTTNPKAAGLVPRYHHSGSSSSSSSSSIKSSTALHASSPVVKTTYEFGNAKDLTPQALGGENSLPPITDTNTKRQLRKFVDGKWRHHQPVKSFGEKILGRTYVIDPYGPVKKVEPQVRTFEDELDDDEYRLYRGLSVGDQMADKHYRVDANGGEYSMKAHTEFRPHRFKFYSMLGLDNLASQHEIREAYRKLVKLYHPDANPDEDTTEQYNFLNRAYEVLTDPILKERYDKYGHRGLGTSAASDDLKLKTGQVGGPSAAEAPILFPKWKRITSQAQVAQSDANDVVWKGSTAGRPFQVVSFGTAPVRERALGTSRNGGGAQHDASNKSTRSRELDAAAGRPGAPKKPPMKDFYQSLSLRRGASDDEIYQAYTILSKRYDPEHSPNKKDCYILYHHVKRAFEVLSDPRLRKLYDLYGFKGLTLPEQTSFSLSSSSSSLVIPTAADGREKYPQRYIAAAKVLPPPPAVQVGGASSSQQNSSSRSTSIQNDRLPLATQTTKKPFKAPPVQYRMTLAPIPLENQNERFDALTRSDSIPLKSPSSSTNAIKFAFQKEQSATATSLLPHADTETSEQQEEELIPFPDLNANVNVKAVATTAVSYSSSRQHQPSIPTTPVGMNPTAVTKRTPPPPPVEVGGAPVHNSSRSTSIQMDRRQPLSHTAKKPFKAPPMEYRMTLAPLPLANANERFDALTRSDSVPIKANAASTSPAKFTLRKEDSTTTTLIPPAITEAESEPTEAIPFPNLDTFHVQAAATVAGSAAANPSSRSSSVVGETIPTTPVGISPLRKIPPLPPPVVGGAPGHNSSRSTSIQQDRRQPASHTARKPFKAPPIEYRMTLAPLPLANENERFDALTRSDSVPLRATTSTSKYFPQKAHVTTPHSPVFEEAFFVDDNEAAALLDEQEADLIPFPNLDTINNVNVQATPVHAATTRRAAVEVAKPPTAAAVTSDQGKLKTARASHQSESLTSSITRHSAAPDVGSDPDEKMKIVASQMNGRNNHGMVVASHHSRAPIHALPTIRVACDQAKLTPPPIPFKPKLLVHRVQPNTSSVERRAAIHSTPPLLAPPTKSKSSTTPPHDSVPQRDFYEILSVKKNADTETIRESYNKLTQEYFADRDTDKDAYIRYQQIQQAFKILRDSAKREEYDLNGMKGVENILSGKWTPPIIDSSSTTDASSTELQKFPDLSKPSQSLSFDHDIVATRPPMRSISSSSTQSSSGTDKPKKEFKAPPVEFRSTIAPLPLANENARFTSLHAQTSGGGGGGGDFSSVPSPLKASTPKTATPIAAGGTRISPASRTKAAPPLGLAAAHRQPLEKSLAKPAEPAEPSGEMRKMIKLVDPVLPSDSAESKNSPLSVIKKANEEKHARIAADSTSKDEDLSSLSRPETRRVVVVVNHDVPSTQLSKGKPAIRDDDLASKTKEDGATASHEQKLSRVPTPEPANEDDDLSSSKKDTPCSTVSAGQQSPAAVLQSTVKGRHSKKSSFMVMSDQDKIAASSPRSLHYETTISPPKSTQGVDIDAKGTKLEENPSSIHKKAAWASTSATKEHNSMAMKRSSSPSVPFPALSQNPKTTTMADESSPTGVDSTNTNKKPQPQPPEKVSTPGASTHPPQGTSISSSLSPISNGSRTSSIQNQRIKPATHIKTEKFKAPPPQYRQTIAPIPLDQDNDRFQKLATAHQH